MQVKVDRQKIYQKPDPPAKLFRKCKSGNKNPLKTQLKSRSNSLQADGKASSYPLKAPQKKYITSSLPSKTLCKCIVAFIPIPIKPVKNLIAWSSSFVNTSRWNKHPLFVWLYPNTILKTQQILHYSSTKIDIVPRLHRPRNNSRFN